MAEREEAERSEPILIVRGLSKSYHVDVGPLWRRGTDRRRRIPALDGIDLDLHQSESLGIVGESGCGKSTLAKCLVMLEQPDGGSVRYRGTEVVGQGRAALRQIRGRIQMVFQDPYSSLNPRMAVREAILEAVRVHGTAETGAEDAYVDRLLDMIGIPALVGDKRPRRMSGGQRQRIAIARALAVNPEILVADEIVSALDVSIQAQILNLLADLRRQFGLSVLFISHDLAVVAQTTDRIMVMYLGKVVETGRTTEVFTNPQHPYTRALLESHPEPGELGMPATPPLQGEIPSAFDVPSGCRFRTRCPHAVPTCADAEPELSGSGNGGLVACHVRPFGD